MERLSDDMVGFRTILKARLDIAVICVGMPDKKFPEHMVKSSEFMMHISKRKKLWKVNLHGLYAN